MRARNIKPGFFTNESLVEMAPLVRLLYAGLWCMADRRGLLEDRPKKIKMEILPCDDIDVDKALEQLRLAGHIVRYTGSNGVNGIQIIRFREHQRPHHEEKANHNLVEPGAEANLGAHQPGESARQPGESAHRPALIPDSGFLNPDPLFPSPTGEGGAESFALSPPAPGSAIAMLMPVREGEEVLSVREVETWTDLYGNVDVPASLNRMRGHWLSKPANQRKTRKGIRTSINTWLAKDHDRRPAARGSPPSAGESREGHNLAVMGSVLSKLGGDHGANNQGTGRSG